MLSASPNRKTPTPAEMLARIAWLLLLVAHTPALLAALQRAIADPPSLDVVRFGLLGATQVFCILKVADVPWLRFPSTSAFWLRFILIVALLHSGVIWNAEPALVDSLVGLTAEALPLVALLALAARLVRRPLRAAERRAERHAVQTRQSLDRSRRLAPLVALRSLLARLRSCLPDRAPPASFAL